MNQTENEAFTQHLRNAVAEAEKLKYRPTQFKRMLETYGGWEAVNRILASGKATDGFEKLWLLGRLDLTCEAIIVETRWRTHFDEDVLARAEKLLTEVGYKFNRFQAVVNDPALLQAASAPPAVAAVPRMAAHASQRRITDAQLGINAFFQKVLDAPVANIRWSWGAVDERTRRVFLRVWRVDLQQLDGKEVIRVLGKSRDQRPGFNERLRHIELLREGYLAFGVQCDKKDVDDGGIGSFDRDEILRLGEVIDNDGMVYVEVVERVRPDEIPLAAGRIEELAEDVAEIERAGNAPTTRAALIDARLGQGRFRRELLRRWGGACAVTGCALGSVLRASHCKPWRSCDDSERLDSSNGLILTANLDALFDAGLIAFDDDGRMLVAKQVPSSARAQLDLPKGLRRRPWDRLRRYLRYHRENVYVG